MCKRISSFAYNKTTTYVCGTIDLKRQRQRNHMHVRYMQTEKEDVGEKTGNKWET